MSHFRARVRYAGYRAFDQPVYLFEVINQHTGLVVATDNHCGLSKLHDEARRMVEVCRLAWSYNLKRKELR